METAGTIILRAQQRLKDESGVQISQQELLRELNAAQLQIVSTDARARMRRAPVLLGAGHVHRGPSGCLRVVGLVRNLGTDGATHGRMILPLDVAALSFFSPEWTAVASRQDADVEGARVNPDNQQEFYVYPAQLGGRYVEVEYAASPPVIAYDAGAVWQSSPLGLEPQYSEALFNLVMHAAYAADSESPDNVSRAQVYLQAYQAAMPA